jgi:3-deoxy-D-manno-octulosonate 8-phosphate phosphatase (KDO 8-P phosphatase)
MQAAGSHLVERARAVRIIGFDIDGVLTDGRLWYGNDGAESKAFHVHDGLGLKLLQQAGIATAVISARASDAAQRRLSELGVTHVHLGVRDKLPVFEQIARDLGLSWYQAAYMGDDLPDLPILTRVVLPATVSEAVPAVRARCVWQATRPAGAGAVREFAEFVLAAQGKLDDLIAPWLGPPHVA